MFNFFKKTAAFLSRDIGIDLGTATVLVYVRGKGVVLKEPSFVAIDKSTDHITKVGKDARAMLGRNPENISVIRPLRDGVINQYIGTVKIMHGIYVEPTKKYADIVINGGKNKNALDLVASRISLKLEENKIG